MNLLERVEAYPWGQELWAMSEGDADEHEIVQAMARACGPAPSVVVSTGAIGRLPSIALMDSLKRGDFGSLIVVGCYDLQNMDRYRAKDSAEVLGDCLRTVYSHAKFALVRGERSLLQLTTANLSRARRSESHWFTDCPTVIAHFAGVLAEWERVGWEPGHGSTYYSQAFGRMWGGRPERALNDIVANWRL
jgi:hypothetical protein